MSRLPDFIIIGAMKAGTTTLYRRLEQLPDVDLPKWKEPHFFSWDRRWSRGVGWYTSLFEDCVGITGEASASYSDAETAVTVSRRMAEVVPNARILFSLRHPIERMRSHYQHQVIRARETRPFVEAVAGGTNAYVTRSLYGKILGDYLKVFEEDQILVFKLHDLDVPDSGAWEGILNHIGALPAEMPFETHNVSSETTEFTRVMRWLWDRNLIPSRRLPAPVRRLGKKLLTREPGARKALLASSKEPVSRDIERLIREDQRLLVELTGEKRLSWPET